MKTVYYYQSICDLNQLLTHSQDIDVIIVSSIHFGKSNNEPYIHLNDNKPQSHIFDNMWMQIQKLYYQGVTITLMIGGAGGAYQNLFNDFNTFYPLLKDLLKKNKFISGIDIDIEEPVDINDVKKFINIINKDFGEDFIITMAPVANSLINDSPGLGNFSYKELYNSDEGLHINWFNTQCYGCFNFNTFDNIIKNNYPPEKICFGMISSDFNNNNFNNALEEIKKVKNKYYYFQGVFNWEYINSPPNINDPSQWCKNIKNI